ncbi:uncharacterized protein FIESC28_02985 [Fusarium coffeatum]|uniref:Uncharacterized protein n=1 Tax=Fusarium coffeatum TaxID=231269 RepID=A0A366S5G9_9HYPO|nr:uncharacterized protein FIESC28_02985 [Fusarium coffeatum]RBR24252.1 hypothetical protein FIESC28_02985 [Fusarium coffeatum]
MCSLHMGKEGWMFEDDPEAAKYGSLPKDPLYGFDTLKQLYLKANSNHEGRYTVPILWDTETHTMVSNESSDIIRMLSTEFDHFLPEDRREVNQPGISLYPEHLRQEIDELNEWIYNDINNDVYKTGFAMSQVSYEENVAKVFKALDRVEKVLEKGPLPFWRTHHRSRSPLIPNYSSLRHRVRTDLHVQFGHQRSLPKPAFGGKEAVLG